MPYKDEVKVLWFETIYSGISGVVHVPSKGSIFLDEWTGNIDAQVYTLIAGKPSTSIPRDINGNEITSTLDIHGNYTLSGVPSAYPICIKYAYKIKAVYLDESYALNSPRYLFEDSNTEVKALWFELINSGVFGIVNVPTRGKIFLDEWTGDIDAKVKTVIAGRPSSNTPKNRRWY